MGGKKVLRRCGHRDHCGHEARDNGRRGGRRGPHGGVTTKPTSDRSTTAGSLTVAVNDPGALGAWNSNVRRTRGRPDCALSWSRRGADNGAGEGGFRVAVTFERSAPGSF